MLEDLPKISGLPFDIRAELLSMLLAEHFGLSIEQVLYDPSHWHQRPGRRDVIELTEDYSHRLEKKLVYIETSREGLADILPESLFLHPEEEFGNNVRKVKALSEQESMARKFLLPFEQLFFWMRLENEYKEWEFGDSLHDWWGRHFPSREMDALPEEHRTAFLEMLPYAQEVVGNWPLTGQWLGMFTGHKVSVREEMFPVYSLPEDLQKRLGTGVLGQDLVLGAEFVDGIPAVNIQFDGLDPLEVVEFLPGGARRALLEDNFIQFLLPVDIPFSIELKCKKTEKPFVLDEDNGANILGYTLHL